MARWLTTTLCTAALLSCHPMRAALDRGALTEACFTGYDAKVPTADPDRDRLHALLMAQTQVEWRIERVSLVDLLPPDAVAVAVGMDELRKQVTYRLTYEARGLPAGATLALQPPTLLTSTESASFTPLFNFGDTDVAREARWMLREPSAPSYERVPAQYLPREFVEETEPGKWVYRGGVDPAQLAIAMLTGGLSAILRGGDLGQEKDWAPLSPSEKAAWKKRQASQHKALDREEGARLAESRKVIEAVLARNQVTKAHFEQQQTAYVTLLAALTELFRADRCLQSTISSRLQAGRRCTLFARESSNNPSWADRRLKKGVLTLRGELRLGDVSYACPWDFKEEIPLEGEETMAQVSARLFSAGPRRLVPVRTTYFE